MPSCCVLRSRRRKQVCVTDRASGVQVYLCHWYCDGGGGLVCARREAHVLLCNSEITDGSKEATRQDAATVLRALSVSNYKPGLVSGSGASAEGSHPRDSDVDCILCSMSINTAKPECCMSRILTFVETYSKVKDTSGQALYHATLVPGICMVPLWNCTSSSSQSISRNTISKPWRR